MKYTIYLIICTILAFSVYAIPDGTYITQAQLDLINPDDLTYEDFDCRSEWKGLLPVYYLYLWDYEFIECLEIKDIDFCLAYFKNRMRQEALGYFNNHIIESIKDYQAYPEDPESYWNYFENFNLLEV